MTNNKVCFITNNVTIIKKRLKLEYLKHKLESKDVLFLHKTHSVSYDDNACGYDVKGQVICMVHSTPTVFKFHI